MKYVLSHDPYVLGKNLFLALEKRQKDILMRRFGLGGSSEARTLEEIGGRYGITRERVRQIEEAALAKIRGQLTEHDQFFSVFEDYLRAREHIVSEKQLFEDFGIKNKRIRNHVHFFLVLREPFSRKREDDHLHHRWFTLAEAEKAVRLSLTSAVNELRLQDRVFTKDEIENIVFNAIRVTLGRKVSPLVLEAWLRLSKLISQNELGEWGPTDSALVNPRGMRDYSYLVFRKLKTPLHFTDVAKNIRLHLGQRAQPQTVHNELIKDDRFVLIGRGLYALREWGYEPGFVKDVIGQVLQEGEALTQEEIVDRVLARRFVKPNTVAINLKDKTTFARLSDGKYKLIK